MLGGRGLLCGAPQLVSQINAWNMQHSLAAVCNKYRHDGRPNRRSATRQMYVKYQWYSAYFKLLAFVWPWISSTEVQLRTSYTIKHVVHYVDQTRNLDTADIPRVVGWSIAGFDYHMHACIIPHFQETPANIRTKLIPSKLGTYFCCSYLHYFPHNQLWKRDVCTRWDVNKGVMATQDHRLPSQSNARVSTQLSISVSQ